MSGSGDNGPQGDGVDKEWALDDQVISLRSEGKSFASIAAEVGVERGVEVFVLFAAAIARRDPAEQERLRVEENARLDVLEQRIRRRPDELDRRRKLASIAKLRQRLEAQ